MAGNGEKDYKYKRLCMSKQVRENGKLCVSLKLGN
jgi:hypothetical protein